MVDQHGVIFSGMTIKKSLAQFDDSFSKDSSDEQEETMKNPMSDSRPMSPDVLSSLSGDAVLLGSTSSKKRETESSLASRKRIREPNSPISIQDGMSSDTRNKVGGVRSLNSSFRIKTVKKRNHPKTNTMPANTKLPPDYEDARVLSL